MGGWAAAGSGDGGWGAGRCPGSAPRFGSAEGLPPGRRGVVARADRLPGSWREAQWPPTAAELCVPQCGPLQSPVVSAGRTASPSLGEACHRTVLNIRGSLQNIPRFSETDPLPHLKFDGGDEADQGPEAKSSNQSVPPASSTARRRSVRSQGNRDPAPQAV